MIKKQVKALVLMSGGLDSILAVAVLKEQGIEVTGLSFKSYFFDTNKAQIAAKQLGIELLEVDFSDEHLEVVKNPKHGYGKNINPCIDCHGFMFLQAKEIMNRDGFDFIATGEVLGQRPKSQTRNALRTVEKYAELENEILRPLSAKLLEPTEAELKDLVDREKLLDIQGRSRHRQIELTKKYDIKEYPSPGGGCLLTDPGYSDRLFELKEKWGEIEAKNALLLKHGRVFWLKSTPLNKGGWGCAPRSFGEVGGFFSLLIIGRNQEENEALMKLKEKGDIIIELKDIMGPVGLLRLEDCEIEPKNDIIEVDIPEKLSPPDKGDFGGLKSDKTTQPPLSPQINTEQAGRLIEKAAIITGYYSTKARGKKVKIKIS